MRLFWSCYPSCLDRLGLSLSDSDVVADSGLSIHAYLILRLKLYRIRSHIYRLTAAC